MARDEGLSGQNFLCEIVYYANQECAQKPTKQECPKTRQKMYTENKGKNVFGKNLILINIPMCPIWRKPELCGASIHVLCSEAWFRITYGRHGIIIFTGLRAAQSPQDLSQSQRWRGACGPHFSPPSTALSSSFPSGAACFITLPLQDHSLESLLKFTAHLFLPPGTSPPQC